MVAGRHKARDLSIIININKRHRFICNIAARGQSDAAFTDAVFEWLITAAHFGNGRQRRIVSQINPNVAKACPKRALKDRSRYASNIDAENYLTADVLLSSPSAAASFVGGASLSGNFKWRDENGLTLGQLEGASEKSI